MNKNFIKVKEKDGAALYCFSFHFGPNPLMVTEYSFYAAVKNGRVEANISREGSFGLFSDSMSQEDFNQKFEEFLARLQGK
jgi:hypothetical protein